MKATAKKLTVTFLILIASVAIACAGGRHRGRAVNVHTVYDSPEYRDFVECYQLGSGGLNIVF